MTAPKLNPSDVGWVSFGGGESAHYSQVEGRSICGKRYRPETVRAPGGRYICLQCRHGHLVRQMHPGRYRRPEAVPLERAQTVTLEHHMASVAMAREAALEEAERVARDPNVPLTGIADAIAAIRGSK